MPNSARDTLVLLASFNGAVHLAEQLKSLEAQTCPVDVWVSDDGSVDDTVKIAESFENVTVIRQSRADKALGHTANFGWLVARALESDYDYFYFCDQDDIWVPEKVKKLNAVLASTEKRVGKSTPVLVHSDLIVVDADAKLIAPSFIDYQGLPDPSSHDFPEFLYQNVVTGCAAGFNKALLVRAAPLPQSAVVHDFWFALVAHSCGIIVFLSEALVLYRQHGANSIGALSARQQTSLLRRHYYQALMKFPAHMRKCIKQARELHDRYRDSMSTDKLRCLTFFAELENATAVEKRAGLPLLFPKYQNWRARLFLRWVLSRMT